MEHRWGARMSIRLPVRLGSDPLTLIHGVLRDVSLSGAYIETNDSPLSRNPLLVELGPADSRSREPLALRAFVVRRDAGGLGIEWCDFAPHPIRSLLASGSRSALGLEETTPLQAFRIDSRGSVSLPHRPSVPSQETPLR